MPCGWRKRPSGSTRANPEAHLQSAHAMGRYAQTIGAVKAIAQGYAGKVRKAIEEALALDPEMAGAHLSLATWHSETINGAGLAARLVFRASRKRALAHYERALELAPDEKLAYLEYALGLLLLKKKRDRGKAKDLLARAIETPSKDAYDSPPSRAGRREAGRPRREIVRKTPLPVPARRFRYPPVMRRRACATFAGGQPRCRPPLPR